MWNFFEFFFLGALLDGKLLRGAEKTKSSAEWKQEVLYVYFIKIHYIMIKVYLDK